MSKQMNERVISISVGLSKLDMDRHEALAEHYNLNKSQVIRLALEGLYLRTFGGMRMLSDSGSTPDTTTLAQRDHC